MYKPLKLENLDTSSGVMTPYYDFDTKVLFVAGKVQTFPDLIMVLAFFIACVVRVFLS